MAVHVHKHGVKDDAGKCDVKNTDTTKGKSLSLAQSPQGHNPSRTIVLKGKLVVFHAPDHDIDPSQRSQDAEEFRIVTRSRIKIK